MVLQHWKLETTRALLWLRHMNPVVLTSPNSCCAGLSVARALGSALGLRPNSPLRRGWELSMVQTGREENCLRECQNLNWSLPISFGLSEIPSPLHSVRQKSLGLWLDTRLLPALVQPQSDAQGTSCNCHHATR